MPLFTIDSEKCNRDGICASECPSRVILTNSPKDVPAPALDMVGYPKFKYPRIPRRNPPRVVWA